MAKMALIACRKNCGHVCRHCRRRHRRRRRRLCRRLGRRRPHSLASSGHRRHTNQTRAREQKREQQKKK